MGKKNVVPESSTGIFQKNKSPEKELESLKARVVVKFGKESEDVLLSQRYRRIT